MISNKNYFQWDLLLPPQVHYCTGYLGIRGAFYNKFPGFLVLELRRKLVIKKTQQGTDKASEHNGCTVFSRALVLLTHESTGVMSTSSYHLSSINYTSSTFVTTYPFPSASAINRVRRHWHDTPPPTTEYAVPLVQTGMQKHVNASPPTAKRGRYEDENVPCRCQPLPQSLHLRGRIYTPPPRPPLPLIPTPPPKLRDA